MGHGQAGIEGDGLAQVQIGGTGLLLHAQDALVEPRRRRARVLAQHALHAIQCVVDAALSFQMKRSQTTGQPGGVSARRAHEPFGAAYLSVDLSARGGASQRPSTCADATATIISSTSTVNLHTAARCIIGVVRCFVVIASPTHSHTGHWRARETESRRRLGVLESWPRAG